MAVTEKSQKLSKHGSDDADDVADADADADADDDDYDYGKTQTQTHATQNPSPSLFIEFNKNLQILVSPSRSSDTGGSIRPDNPN